MHQTAYISCDWGTSNLRVCLIDVSTGSIIAQATGPGIKETNTLFNNALESGERIVFFQQILTKCIASMKPDRNFQWSKTPIVISGMASSSIGMKEVEYGPVPCQIKKDLRTELIGATDVFQQSILLVSGLRTDEDVMRGEETQILGCMELSGLQSFTILLPGTHSKHAQVQEGVLTSFSTYMTGEFFNLLTTYSILSTSLKDASGNVGGYLKSFESGVQKSINTSILHEAFMVRTNSLFNKYSHAENFHFLSGLLIGYELCSLRLNNIGSLLICGDEKLVELYKHALAILDVSKNVIFISAEHAVIAGHRLLLGIPTTQQL